MNDKTLPPETDFEALALDQQEFTENMQEVFQVSQKIWEAFLEAEKDEQKSAKSDPMNTMPAFNELATAIWSDPQKLAESTQKYWQAQGQIW